MYLLGVGKVHGVPAGGRFIPCFGLGRRAALTRRCNARCARAAVRTLWDEGTNVVIVAERGLFAQISPRIEVAV